tara:strand:+ start:402 stop:1034 length:633 start_codon:yes stop_codon:yes gene_type:complete
MANYIKIPISKDTGLPLAASGAIVTVSNWDFASITTVTASQSSGPLSSTVAPSGGSSAQFTFTTSSGSDISIAVDNAGDGYKIGDVITVSVPSGGINGDGSAKDVTVTLTADMLASSSDFPEELIPIDNVLSSTTGDKYVRLFTDLLTAGNNLAYFEIEIDNDSSSSTISDQVLMAVDDTMKKAIKAPNSQPTVVFPGSTSCFNVKYVTE